MFFFPSRRNLDGAKEVGSSGAFNPTLALLVTKEDASVASALRESGILDEQQAGSP